MRNKKLKKRLYLTGFLVSFLITSPSIANPLIIGPRENITKGTSAGLPVRKIYINEGSLANNYPMKISDMIDKRSWMDTCFKEIGSSFGGGSGKNVCSCLWDKLESPWYDANSQYETQSAATLCTLEEMKRTMPY